MSSLKSMQEIVIEFLKLKGLKLIQRNMTSQNNIVSKGLKNDENWSELLEKDFNPDQIKQLPNVFEDNNDSLIEDLEVMGINIEQQS